MTSKQRANLRSQASVMDSIFQVGKENLSDNIIKGISEALEARELIKISVLKSSDMSTEEVSQEIASKTRSEIVSTIGNKVILYRLSHATNVKHIEL